MFITDPLSPAQLLAELLANHRCADWQTKRFADLAHNADLCPAFQKQIDAILGSYMRIKTDVRDVQGLRDQGTDVMLRYEDENGETIRVGLQIKSYKEIDDWKNKKDGGGLIGTLKAQCADALHRGRVERWYIVLCADAKLHANQVRTVSSEFESYNNVTVVLPQNAMAFLEMDGLELMVHVAHLLCAHDTVLTAAQESFGKISPFAAYLMIALTCRYFGDGLHVIDDENLMSLCYDAHEHLGQQGDIHVLLDDAIFDLSGVNFLAREEFFIVDPTVNIPLCAVYFVSKLQYRDRNMMDLVDYIAALLDVKTPEKDEEA